MEQKAYREMAETEKVHWWFTARRAIIKDILDGLNLPSDARILEVGSGTGGNLNLLRQFGDLSAVEMDEYAREHAKDETGLDVRYGSLPDELPSYQDKFDLICLFDVLEHVERDRASLRVLREVLKPEGRLFITVPAYPWMWTNHDRILHHHRRYTKPMLAERLREAELTIDRLTHFNCFLFPAAVAARVATMATGGEGSPGSAFKPGLVNSTLSAIFRSERAVLKRTDPPFGLSVMAIASR